MSRKNTATIFALLAAAFYAINIPLSKLMLGEVEPTMMAAFLYLGAGAGLLIYSGVCRLMKKKVIKEPLTKKELPYTLAMIALDIIAPILLMYGVSLTNSANVSLLNNFEIVATSLIAFFIFKEMISARLTAAIILVTAASMILGFEGSGGFGIDNGAVFVLGACVCWGLENNCTKMLSSKSSIEIVTIKGCFSGTGSLIVALVRGEQMPSLPMIGAVMLLGFVAYGLSINFYIMAQKELGAAKTSAYYSIAPFLGVLFSLVILGERPRLQFYIASAVMAAATVLMIKDSITLQHTHEHEHTHTHEHSHGELRHTHEHSHIHTHMHTHSAGEEEHLHSHRDFGGHDHCHE